MYNILCEFDNSYKINSDNIIKFNLTEELNSLPSLTIVVPKWLLEKHYNVNKCVVYINDIKFFSGTVELLETCDFLLTIKIKTIAKEINKNNISSSQIDKFKKANPDLFIIDQSYDRFGNIVENYEKNWSIDFFSQYINSLETIIDNSQQIYKIDLILKASWIRTVSDNLDLTNKIRMAFGGKSINTITPKALLHTWPKVFDSIPVVVDKETGITTQQTKYFVSYSKLLEYEKDYFPISLNTENNERKLSINKVIFNHKLIIGWEYDQHETEELHIVIENPAVPYGKTKKINIDLHNMQEYLEDRYQVSFFYSHIGSDICNVILQEMQKLMINSMKNMTIKFKMLNCEVTNEFNILDNIKISDNELQIIKIERNITSNENITIVEAKGNYTPYVFTEEKTITKQLLYNREIDVINNINVYNSGDEQLMKLNKFINTNKMSVSNYKNLINKFLNENKTSIVIKTKPLKKKAINKKEIIIDEKLGINDKLKLETVVGPVGLEPTTTPL